MAGLIIAGAGVFALILAIPLPSFQRSLDITNQLATLVEVKCKALDGDRERTFQLQPHEHGAFVYFAGDHGGPTSVLVQLEAKVLPDGVAVRRQLDLPVDSQPPGVALSEKWFAPDPRR